MLSLCVSLCLSPCHSQYSHDLLVSFLLDVLIYIIHWFKNAPFLYIQHCQSKSIVHQSASSQICPTRFIDTNWIQWIFKTQTGITNESNDAYPLQCPLTISVQFSYVQCLILNDVLMIEWMNRWCWSSVWTAAIVISCWQIRRRFLRFFARQKNCFGLIC